MLHEYLPPLDAGECRKRHDMTRIWNSVESAGMVLGPLEQTAQIADKEKWPRHSGKEGANEAAVRLTKLGFL